MIFTNSGLSGMMNDLRRDDEMWFYCGYNLLLRCLCGLGHAAAGGPCGLRLVGPGVKAIGCPRISGADFGNGTAVVRGPQQVPDGFDLQLTGNNAQDHFCGDIQHLTWAENVILTWSAISVSIGRGKGL